MSKVDSVARRARTRRHSPKLLRWLGIGVVVLIGLAYVQPLRSYLHAKGEVARASDERAALLRKQGALRHKLEETTTDAFLVQEARRLGLVLPGERLYIVKGVGKPEVR